MSNAENSYSRDERVPVIVIIIIFFYLKIWLYI